jgi:hypothetical protein
MRTARRLCQGSHPKLRDSEAGAIEVATHRDNQSPILADSTALSNVAFGGHHCLKHVTTDEGEHTHSIQRYDERFKGVDRIAESILEVYIPVKDREPGRT